MSFFLVIVCLFKIMDKNLDFILSDPDVMQFTNKIINLVRSTEKQNESDIKDTLRETEIFKKLGEITNDKLVALSNVFDLSDLIQLAKFFLTILKQE